jgi:hypothetical protein
MLFSLHRHPDDLYGQELLASAAWTDSQQLDYSNAAASAQSPCILDNRRPPHCTRHTGIVATTTIPTTAIPTTTIRPSLHQRS